MEVLYTAGQAELGEYKFMVLKNDGPSLASERLAGASRPSLAVASRASAAPRRPPGVRSRRVAHSVQRSAYGSAASRRGSISCSQSRQTPYSPASSRARAASICSDLAPLRLARAARA